MSRKRLLISLASVAALAAFSVTAAVAQATPRFYVNGVLAGASKQNVELQGTMTLSNAFLGNIKCTVIAYGTVANESERGVGDIEGYKGYDCTSEPACQGVFATTEPLVVRKVFTTHGWDFVAEYGPSTLPWSGEAIEEEGTEKRKKFKMPIRLTIVEPCFSPEGPFPYEAQYEATLEPLIINGARNGLKPTHLEFVGSGGPGSLTMSGSAVQLVTAD
jgi:hypothetical protein